MKLVRALRKGWIQTTEQRKVTREEPAAYLLWADDGVASEKIANGEQTVVLRLQNSVKAPTSKFALLHDYGGRANAHMPSDSSI